MNEGKEIPQQQPVANYAFHQPYFPPNPIAFGQMPMYQPRQTPPQNGGNQGMLPMQQSYIENILRLNRGKLGTFYFTFEGNNQKAFTGIIEAAGRDHLILSNENTEERILLLMVYLDYATFNEEINYDYPFGDEQLATYSPR